MTGTPTHPGGSQLCLTMLNNIQRKSNTNLHKAIVDHVHNRCGHMELLGLTVHFFQSEAFSEQELVR